MKYITLRELCDKSGVSRRAIQGYEKAGLIHAHKKNERGYLLYDSKTIDLVRLIRFYQQIGFQIKEITVLWNAPDSVVKDALKKKEKLLELQLDDLTERIHELRSLIQSY